MADKQPDVPLRDVLAADRDFAELLLREEVPVNCVNRRTRESRVMSFKPLYQNNRTFWLQKDSSWEFFISAEDLAQARAKAEAAKGSPGDWQVPPAPAAGVPVEPAAEPAPVETGFGPAYGEFAAMTQDERVERMKDDKKLLDSLAVQKPRQAELIITALVDSSGDAFLANRAALIDAMRLSDEEAKKHTQGLVDSTRDLIRTSSHLVTQNIFNDDLMNTLVAKSNGTIIQHMTRVFLNGMAFFSFFNELVSGSSTADRLRISFKSDRRYQNFYRQLLPHLAAADALGLERVFMGGMRAVSEKDFQNWSIGLLIHDIGKAAAVEYHEGETAYDRNIVVEHVKVGFSSVMKKTNYPREAGLITGYHHEYYGDPAGYGYFRSYLEQYRKANPAARQDFCITYELEHILDYAALAYFPAKVLEIVDVYDSVTDPNRRYRKAMAPEEALAMMDDEFIVQHHKIDPVLFDIFASFVRSRTAAV